MVVPMVDIRVMRMGVDHRLVTMCVGMRFAWQFASSVGVLVVLIVHVQMLVLQRFVSVLMFVALCEMEPNAQRHEDSGQAKSDGESITKIQNRDGRANEWRDGEVCTCPRGPNVPKREHE